MSKLLTTGQAAERCSVTPDTVLRWIKGGRLPATRTAGGHYRIAPEEVERLRSPAPARGFKYCWEFNSEDGELREGCESCLVYRARAMRCYELAELHPENGHSKLFCQESCEECDYYRTVKGRAANVLVVTKRKDFAKEVRSQTIPATFNLAVADCEYSVSAVVESFRPDYAVIDCGLGTERARDIAIHLVQDPRVHLIRVILAAAPGEYPEECDRQVFAHIERPFGFSQIRECINGIRQSATA